MSWIDKIFHRTPKAPQQPTTPAPSQPNGDSSPAPANPQDQVTIGQNGKPTSGSSTTQPPIQSQPNVGNPNGTTPAGLPGAPSANSGSSVPTTISVDPTTGKPITEDEKKAQADRLRDRLKVIESVGRGLSGDYKMGLEGGDAWAYDFGTNTIIYKTDDLQGKSEDYAIGVILQETGRRIYSRQPTAPEFKENPALDFLNNAVEGPRVCNLQGSKYAGAKQFFKTVYDEDLLKKTEESIQQDMINSIAKNLTKMYVAAGQPEKQAHEQAVKEAETAVLKLKSPVPRHMQFALGMIYDWYTDGKGESPDWMRDKNAMRALEACKPDFREAMKLQRDVFEKDLSPKEVIEQSKKSEDIVVNKLWPVYKQLLEMDQKDLGQSMFGNQPGQQGQQGQQSGQGQQSQQGQQGQQSGQGQQSQQGKPQQGQQGKQSGQGQPSQSGQSGEGQQSQQSGKPGEGKGQGKPSDDAKDKQGQGAGGADDAKEEKEKQDGAAGAEDKDKQGDPNAAKEGQGGKEGQGSQAGKGGDAGVPDPKKVDTSDGGKLDDSKLTDEQRQRIKDIMDEMDKQADRKIKSREQRDKEDGVQNQGKDSSQANEGSGNGRGSSQIDLPTLQKLLEQKAETEKQVENLKTPYEKYFTELAPLTDEMAGQLKNILQENSDMKYVGDFKSGRKLDMRRAMQSSAKFERTGMYDEDIWLRRQDPSKRDYDFVFILDESGSMMDDNKWDNLLKGLVMGAESLEQLKINFSVVGFSDQPQLHKEFKDKYDTTFREQMLAQIQQSPHGGTNDSDALQTALDMLSQRPAENQKIVIIITDGQGKEAELKKQIALAELAGVQVIGVGIGEGMSYVKQVYPQSVAVSRVNDLPYQLTDLIREKILDGLKQESSQLL